jgi:hypothetical protein
VNFLAAMFICRASSRISAFVLLWVVVVGVLHADGGRVLAEKQVGVYRVVLFGNPSPLRAGPADLSLFLEQAERSGPILDAVVNFRLNKLSRPTPELAWKGAGCVTPGQAVPASQGHAGNGLLYSAMLGIPEPGLWELGVSISREGKMDFVSFELPVDRALPPMLTWWLVVALMPLGVLLYIWRGYLKKRRAL